MRMRLPFLNGAQAPSDNRDFHRAGQILASVSEARVAMMYGGL